MSDLATFDAGDSETEFTGRYIVTFREEAVKEGLAAIANAAGVRNLANAADYEQNALDAQQAADAGGGILDQLGIAVFDAPPDAVANVADASAGDSPILSVEQERVMHILPDPGPGSGQGGGSANVSLDYLKGYADALADFHKRLSTGETAAAAGAAPSAAAACLSDNDDATWGLQATGAVSSSYTGRGIRVAILDTGFDLQHPDFAGRSITSQSFISGEEVDDKNGHGTHCTGTSCGPRSPSNVPGYGVAPDARIFIGKVLSNAGRGGDMGILAGINWAVANKCHVINMSLGASVRTRSTAYETAGQRALGSGSLIIAAAGNNARRSEGNPGFVGRPANSWSIMAVGAVDSCLQIANFSARTSGVSGGEVDIAGPGVAIFSSWPLDKEPGKYRSINGTSMATPHVAGVAALLAEAYQAEGPMLYYLLVALAQRLELASVDVGAGLVIAP